MPTWPTLADLPFDHTVTEIEWNALFGVNGALAWLHAYQDAIVTKTAQSVASGQFVKLQLTTETANPNSWLDNATSFRFQPTHAGKYHLAASAYFTATNGPAFVALYKNGSATGIYSWGNGIGNDFSLSTAFD